MTETAQERFEISGDFDSKEVQHDGSLTVTYSPSTSSLTTVIEVLCVTSAGTPKLLAPHVDRSDPTRVVGKNRRGDNVGVGKGFSFEPPVEGDSGTFACRTSEKGNKRDRDLVINFQGMKTKLLITVLQVFLDWFFRIRGCSRSDVFCVIFLVRNMFRLACMNDCP